MISVVTGFAPATVAGLSSLGRYGTATVTDPPERIFIGPGVVVVVVELDGPEGGGVEVDEVEACCSRKRGCATPPAWDVTTTGSEATRAARTPAAPSAWRDGSLSPTGCR